MLAEPEAVVHQHGQPQVGFQYRSLFGEGSVEAPCGFGCYDFLQQTHLASFAALPSNISALNSVMSFSQSRRPFVAIQGASGWGKSHCLRVAYSMSKARYNGAVHLASANELNPGKTNFERSSILILDDVQLGSAGERSHQYLQILLERRLRASKPTLCALGGAEPRPLGRMLPFPSRWQVATIGIPTVEERHEIIRSMCATYGLSLPDQLVALVARIIQGEGHSLLGAVLRLKCAAARETDFSQISAIRLAGLLHPYLVDHCDCDLRDVVLDAVTKSSGSHADRDAARLTAVAVYALSCLAGISEESIATYFGMKQSDVYLLCNEVVKRLEVPDLALRSQLERVLCLTTGNLCEN